MSINLSELIRLVPQREHQEARGSRLYVTGQPYSACATEAERDGYEEAQAEALGALADQARLQKRLAALTIAPAVELV